MSQPDRPYYVYDNWSAYDELSDNIPLTEELALFQLEQVKRLMSRGVKCDAYLMDAYWYDPAGAYKTWRKDRFPDGPDKWLDACQEAGLAPGLWFPANTAFTLDIPEGWESSLDPNKWGFCCFEGNFLEEFLAVLDHWYQRGIRVYKFDFADFMAAPAAKKLEMLPSEIRAANVAAYRSATAEFKRGHPGVKLLAYNGFEEAEFMPWTDRPIRRVLDPAWLEVFDSIYCGDPRPADLPSASLWRSLDVYADHQIRAMNLTGFPLARIDNCALMLGKTGTCYWRGSQEWRTTCLLSYARGGNIHVTMGNLENLSDEDATWMAEVQSLYEAAGTPELVGGIPGKGESYGYRARSVSTFVNPGLSSTNLANGAPIIYSDGLCGDSLGPGSVVVTSPTANELGHSKSNADRAKLHLEWTQKERQAEVTFQAEPASYHFGFSQFDAHGLAVRSSTGADGHLLSSASFFRLEATLDGEKLEIDSAHDTKFWSGISWCYGVAKLPKAGQLVLRVEALDPAVKSLQPFLLRQYPK